MQISVFNTNNYETESVEDILVISQQAWEEDYPVYAWSLPDTEEFQGVSTECATCDSSATSGIGVNTYYTAVGGIVGGTLLLLAIYYYATKVGYCGGDGNRAASDLHKSLLDDTDISVNIDTTANPIVADSGFTSRIHSSDERGGGEVEAGQGGHVQHHSRVDTLLEKA